MQITFREIGTTGARSHNVSDSETVRARTTSTHLELHTTVDGNIHILEPSTRRAIVFNGEPRDVENLPRAVITDELVECAAKAAFNRPGVIRGCHWEPNYNPTTEAEREEFRGNARAAIEAAIQFMQDAGKEAPTKDAGKPEWDAVTVKEVEYDPSDREGMERMLRVGIHGIVSDATGDALTFNARKGLTDRLHTYFRRYQEHAPKVTYVAPPEPLPDDALARIRKVHTDVTGMVSEFFHQRTQEPTHETILTDRLVQYVLNQARPATPTMPVMPDPLTFGQFWDAMAELLEQNDLQIVVFRTRGGAVHSANRGRMEDGATRCWYIVQDEARSAGTKHTGVPLHHVSYLSGFQILGTYRNETDAPF